MPASARTWMRVWKNSRVVNTGSATHGVGPRAVEIKSDDIDISDTSNSAKRSCRQNISDGWRTVGESAMLRGRPRRGILFLAPFLRRDNRLMSRVWWGLFAPCRGAHGNGRYASLRSPYDAPGGVDRIDAGIGIVPAASPRGRETAPGRWDHPHYDLDTTVDSAQSYMGHLCHRPSVSECILLARKQQKSETRDGLPRLGPALIR